MTPTDLDFLSALIQQRSGIVVTREKEYLLENRLAPLVAQHKMAGMPALVTALRQPSNEALVREAVEAMTTNETLFFRDTRPFDTLRTQVLPSLLAARASSRTLRFWSAACSTGQEPYSVAMLLKEESARLAGWRTTIVATDIARTVLAKAKAGVYSQFEVQRGLPIHLLVKYFTQTGTQWEIKPEVQSMVEFREHNVARDAPPGGPFDVIFCRNLLIYFDQDLKRAVLGKLADVLAPDGVLFLGGAESVLGVTDRLEPVPDQRGVYRRAERAVPARRAVGERG